MKSIYNAYVSFIWAKTVCSSGFASGLTLSVTSAQAEDRSMLNVSYDATREFYDEFKNKPLGKEVSLNIENNKVDFKYL